MSVNNYFSALELGAGLCEALVMKIDDNKTMANISRRLGRYTTLCETHCGHDERVSAAVRSRLNLLDFIRSEMVRASTEQPEIMPDPIKLSDPPIQTA